VRLSDASSPTVSANSKHRAGIKSSDVTRIVDSTSCGRSISADRLAVQQSGCGDARVPTFEDTTEDQVRARTRSTIQHSH